MVKVLRYILIGFFISFLTNDLFAQTPTTSDCLGAVPICNTSYSYGASPSNEGNYPNEINPSSCLASGELNSAWFIFTVQSSGQLKFLITPNNASDDYDWAVYNLTNANCNNIYSNSSLQVSCNYSDVVGATGPNGGSTSNNQSALGTPFNATIPVSVGQTYVINVSNYSSTTSGYTIDFTGSSAQIYDNVPPAIQSITTPSCGATTLTFNFSENILCSSVSASDFTLTGPGGPYTITSVSGSACLAGATNENTFTVNVSPAITTGGSYTLNLVGSVTDNCGNAAPANSLGFTIGTVATPTASGTTICSNNSTTLTASNSTGSYQWYSAATGGTLLSSSASYSTPVLTTTTTYYVQAMSGICSSTRVPVTVTVNPTPANPTAAGTTICSNNTATLTATAPGGTYNWYNAASGGSLLGTGSSFTTPVLSSSTTYYVDATSTGCTGGRTAVTVTVNPTPSAPSASGTTICSNNSAILTATAPGGTYDWYNAASGGTLLESGASYNTGNLSSTTTYYVSSTISGCTGPRTPVTVTVNPTPAAPTATGTTICSGNTATVTATAPGGTYNWYNAASGGTLVNTGATYTTGILSTTTTYYVDATSSGCTGARTPVTITVNPQDNAAFSYTGSSFCQSGSNQNPTITGTPGGTFSSSPAGLSLNSSSGQIVVGTSTVGSYTVTYQTAGVCPASSTQNITVTTAPVATFTYSGPYCTNSADPSPTFSGGGSAGTFSSAAGLVFVNSSTGQIDLSACTPGTYNVTNTIAASGGCSAASATSSVTINAAPVANAGTNQTICSGQSVSIGAASVAGSTYSWSSVPAGFSSVSSNPSVSPTVTTVYQVTETVNASGCAASNTVTVTVNPTPVAPTAAPQAICEGNTATLTATAPGGTYEWFDAASGGTLLQTGANYTTPILTSGTTYYVQSTSGTCTGTRTAVNVTVNPIPVITAGNDDSLCTGSSVQLQANGGAAYTWGPSTGLSSTAISNPVADPSASTTYTVTGTSAAGCISTDTVLVKVLNSPTALVNGVTNICSGTNAVLSAASSSAGSGAIAAYQWLESNNPVAGANGPTLTVTSAGNYSVIVENTNGCKDTSAAFSVNVFSAPVATITGNNSYCAGDSVNLSGLTSSNGTGTINAYQWMLNGSPAGSSSTLYATAPGNYTLVVTDDNGCSDTSAIHTVNENLLPVATYTGLPNSICISSPSVALVPLTAGGVFTGTGMSGATFDPSVAGVGGPYTIQYSVTDGNGCSNSYSDQVSVTGLPDATFTGLAASYCADAGIVSLSPNSIGGTFSGPGVSGLTFDPASAGVGGPYTIKYVNTSGVCTDSTSQQVVVNALPDATFSGLSSSYCISSGSATLTPVLSGGTFSGTGITGNNFDPSLAGIGGPYLIQYDVTDGNGCSASATQQVTVNGLPDATFTGLQNAYCVDAGSVTLVPNAAGGTFNGTGVNGSTFEPGTAGVGGAYEIEYVITDNNGCSDSTSQLVTVNALPDATFSALAVGYCVDGSAVTLVPVTAGGTFTGQGVTGNSFDPAAAGTGGPYTVQYSVTDGNGCQAQSSQQVSVYALPDATFTGLGNSYCSSATAVTLTPATAGGTFSGIGINGNTFDPSASPTGGTFNVSYSVTDGNGCSNSSIQTVTITTLPVIDRTALVVDSADCGLSTGQITGVTASGNAPFTYYWLDSNNDTISTGTSSQANSLAAGTYSLIVTDANGCSSVSGPDTVYMRPGVTAAFTCSVDSGAAPLWVVFSNSSIGAVTYNWTFGESGGTATDMNPGKLFKEEGVYEVMMIGTSATGCSDTALVKVIVTEDIRIEFPNVFSPNDDGLNDLFHFNTSGLADFNCVIFNRWGETVYEWNTLNSGWDGKTLAGIDAPDGVYYFILKATGKDGQTFQKESTVTLVR